VGWLSTAVSVIAAPDISLSLVYRRT